MAKIQFLHVKKDYIDYLKQFDTKVQNNYDDSNHKKPYISGIIIEINGKEYLAPLTSYKPEKYDDMEEKTIFKIVKHYTKREADKLGVILFNNMIPLIENVFEKIEFHKYDEKYRSLLQNQYRCISKREAIDKINKIANSVYKEVVEYKSNHFIQLCCDFKQLEKASEEYQEKC